jgi:hypothetical protein
MGFNKQRYSKVEKRNPGMEQHVTLRGYPSVCYHLEAVDTAPVSQWYFGVPVSRAIPPQHPHFPPFKSDAYPQKRQVTIKGVKLEFMVEHLFGFDFSLVCHKAIGTYVSPVDTDVNKVPKSFPLGIQEERGHRLMTLEETGLCLSRDGPYRVPPSRGAVGTAGQVSVPYSLETCDGTIFECPLQEGERGSLGTVQYRIGAKGSGKAKVTGVRTVNDTVNCPSTHGMATDRVSAYFLLKERVELKSEDSNNLVGSQHLQITCMVKPKAIKWGVTSGKSVLAGTIRDVLVTVYYRN